MSDRGRAWRLAALTAGLWLAIDQATKQLVASNVARGDSYDIFFGLELTYVRNRGVAFGVLEGGEALVTVLTLVPLAALLAYFAVKAATPHLWLPIGLVTGGALGNLLDRARDGSVIDFIDPFAWPAFNLADVGIVVGLLGVFYVVEGEARR
jgi:signal peptidase II